MLLGSIAWDIDVRTTAKGKTVARFKLSVPKRRLNEMGKRTYNNIQCICWGPVADFCAKYLAKGAKVCISGEIDTGNYMKNGQKVYFTQVIANSIEFAGNKVHGANGEGPAFGENLAPEQAEKEPMDVFQDVTDDVELPFM